MVSEQRFLIECDPKANINTVRVSGSEAVTKQ